MGNEAAEKTEQATSRRRSKERERGNVAKSKDMESALVMIAGIALLAVFSKHMYTSLTNMLRETFTNLNPASIDTTSIVGILYPYFKYLGITVLPFFVLLFIIAIIIIPTVIFAAGLRRSIFIFFSLSFLFKSSIGSFS